MNFDKQIVNVPEYEKEMPDYIKLAKEKYDTLEDLMEWLKLTDDDITELPGYWHRMEAGSLYGLIFINFEGQIESKIAGEL